jgi:RND family efflux transporter MFP subunit
VKSNQIVGILLKAVLPTVAGLVVLVLVMAALAGFFREKIPPGAVSVEPRKLGDNDQTDVVHEVTKQYIEEAVGTLRAASRTEISSRVLALIDRITVGAGDTVQEGDVLIELDRQALETQLSRAKASLAEAGASVSQADDEYHRAERLRASPVPAITEAEFNAIASKLQVAQAKQQQAEQALAEVKVLLSYTTIRAPKAGMIVDKRANQGDMAQPGIPLLVLYDPTSLRLEVPVMENLAVKLKRGAELTIKIDALDRHFTATIDEIVPQAEAASRSFLVKVTLPPSEELFEGMYGRLQIPSGKRRHLCLATAAIQTIGQLQFVDVVKGGQTLERRFIKTGRLGMPGRVEVLSGLQADETVLLRSPTDVPGMKSSATEAPADDE